MFLKEIMASPMPRPNLMVSETMAIVKKVPTWHFIGCKKSFWAAIKRKNRTKSTEKSTVMTKMVS